MMFFRLFGTGNDNGLLIPSCAQVGDRQYRNQDNNKCLSVRGSALVLANCADYPSPQQWEVKRTGSVTSTQTPAPTSSATPKPTSSSLLSCKNVNFKCGNDATLIDNYCGKCTAVKPS